MYKFLIYFILPSFLFSQNSSNIELLGHIGESNGNCTVVEAIGDTIFCVEGKGFKILDYSDKEDPKLLNQSILPDENFNAIEINGNHVYLLSNFYLIVLDINDYARPIIISKEKIDFGKNLELKDDYLYVTYGIPYYPTHEYSEGGLIIFDISNPNSVYKWNEYQSEIVFNDIAIYDTIAFISVIDSILIFNISDVSSPKLVSKFECFEGNQNLLVEDKILFVISPYNGLNIFNITSPTEPYLIGELDESGINLLSKNKHLFIAQTLSGDGPDDTNILIVDIQDPTTPIKISEINPGDYGAVQCLSTSNNLLYVAHSSSGLFSIDISDINNPIEKSRYKTGYRYDLEIAENYAYIASGYQGIQIFDISDKINPHLVSSIKLNNHPADRTKKVAIEDNYLYFMVERFSRDFVNSIFIADISSPLDPKIISSFDTNLMTDFTVKNKMVYLTGYNNFTIVDVANPDNPIIVDTFTKDKGAGTDIVVLDNIAFLSDWAQGLNIMDISDPKNLSMINNYNSYCVGDFYIENDKAYIIAQSHLDPEFSLRVLDLSDMNSINELGALDLSENSNCIAYQNEKVVIGEKLKIIDVSNPEDLKIIDSTNICSKITDIVIDGRNIYVTDGSNGLYIFQYDKLVSISDQTDSNIQKFELMQNFPNPFNPITTIKFCLPEKAKVKLDVYDILGSKITNLINSEMNKGIHKVDFNGKNLPSGIYFYHLSANNFSDTKKLVLIK